MISDRLRPKTPILFAAPLCAIVLAALAIGTRADDATHTLRARVTLNHVMPDTPAVEVTVRETNVTHGADGENHTYVFRALRSGEASPWINLEAPSGTRYWPITIEAKGVRFMSVTLEIENDGVKTTLQEAVQGKSALFWKNRDAATKQIVFIPGSQGYREGLELARAVAVPEAERPRRFIISDRLYGPGPVSQALDDGLGALAALGINTVELAGWGDLSREIAARARTFGINRFQVGTDAPPSLSAWEHRMGAAPVEEWAQQQVQHFRALGLPPADTVVFRIADAPGSYFPSVLRQFPGNVEAVENFRTFLRYNNLKPEDVGATSWDTVLPAAASDVHDLPSRCLFYWTVRYANGLAALAFKVRGEALRRAFSVEPPATPNSNTPVHRFFIPAPGPETGDDTEAAATAYGSLDWTNAGRQNAGTALWAEDGFEDRDAQTWSLYADVLRGAAGGGQFGSIVGKTLGAHPAGARYKALALIGHGVKALEWNCYGPATHFPETSYAENRAAYAQIASANRIIARAEDLLFPGKRPPARIAVLLPGSAQVWDKSRPLPLYQREIAGLHYALTHSHYAIDFIDEEGLADKWREVRFSSYQMIYITSPNLAAASQVALRNWIDAGGTAIFSPGAAAADEYNTPVDVLDEARGVKTAVLPRKAFNEDATKRAPLTFRDTRFGSNTTITRQTAPLEITTARAVANFADGQVALASNSFGKGLALSYGFWPGINYLNSADYRSPNRLPFNWNENLRFIVNAAPRTTNIRKQVELNVPVVEASRLESAEGVAVTLLNWTDKPIEKLEVTIRDVGRNTAGWALGAGNVTSVTSVEQGVLPFTRDGNDVRVLVPLRDVDVLMIRR